MRDFSLSEVRLTSSNWAIAEHPPLLWRRSEPFLDTLRPNFAANDFHATFWEMYLAASLDSLGLPLVRREAKRNLKGGPNLQVAENVWVEAIVATAGTTADRVPAVDDRWEAPAQLVPDRARSTPRISREDTCVLVSRSSSRSTVGCFRAVV